MAENKKIVIKEWHSIFVAMLLFVVSAPSAKAMCSDHSDMDVVLLGDSNTWLGGEDCSNSKGWSKWFKDAFIPKTIGSYARSGATWTNTPSTVCNLTENIEVLGDNNVVYNQVCRLKYAYAVGEQPVPELIIISAGTNDAWFSQHRPYAMQRRKASDNQRENTLSLEPSKNLTIEKSIALCCELLREDFPDAEIVLLTPLQTIKVDKSIIGIVGELIESVGTSLGCHVIRQDVEGCVRSDEELVEKVNTYDGTHTSERGARLNGEMIACKVCEFICKENKISE